MRYVIFDMDGVLLDSELGFFSMFRETLRTVGIEETLENLLSRYVGMTTRAIAADLIRVHHAKITVDEFMAMKDHEGCFYAGSDAVKPFDGLCEFLDFLQGRGIRMAVVSSTLSKDVLAALNRMRILKWFDAVVCGDAVTESKPSPQGYRKAMEFLGAAPSECLIIEDSRNGVQAAINAGAAVAAFKGSVVRQDTSKACLEAYSYDELREKLLEKGLI